MRHRIKGKILKRKRNSRRALIRGLLSSLIMYGKIETTRAKAQAMKPKVERLITLARVDKVSQRRFVRRSVGDESVKKLFDILGPRYQSRSGGYTRIIKLTPRKGDNAERVIIEFV